MAQRHPIHSVPPPLLALLATLLALTACAPATVTPPAAAPTPSPTPTPPHFLYQDPTHWYTVAFPGHWTVFTIDTLGKAGGPPILVARQQPRELWWEATIMIISLPLPEGRGLDFLTAHWSFERMARDGNLPPPQLEGDTRLGEAEGRNLNLRGEGWHRFDLLLPVPGRARRWQAYMTTAGEVGFVLLFSGPNDVFDSYQPLYEGVLRSFTPTPPTLRLTARSEVVGTWERADGGRLTFRPDGRYRITFPGEPANEGEFRTYNGVIYLFSDAGDWNLQVYRAYGDALIVDQELYLPVPPSTEGN